MASADRRPVEVDQSLRNCCEKFEKGVRFLLPLILLVIYSFVGGFVFHLIEEPNEKLSREKLSENLTLYRGGMIQNLSRIARFYDSPNREERFSEELMNYHKLLGVAEKEGEYDWNFWGATFYAMTLYTTIGYGNIAPKTTEGQVLTLVYSIIGIPLCLAAIVQIGIIVAYAVVAIWRCSCNCIRRPKAQKRATNSTGAKQTWTPVAPNEDLIAQEQDVDLLSLPVSILFLVTILWTLLTALLFWCMEPWSYFESLYFTFISFSTIGLGDYVPTQQKMMLLTVFFVLVGLALLSTLFAVIQQQLEALKNSLKRAIDREYQESQMDETATAGPKGAVIDAEAGKGAEGRKPMTNDARDVDAQIKRMVSKLPLSSRFLYWAMSDEEKAKLKKYWLSKAGLQSRGTQTDERWMRASYLERIGEEDDRRSHDDVNSLVAFCDYALQR